MHATNKSLKWNANLLHKATFMKELHISGTGADVTIVCDDQKQLKVHKLILASQSAFLKSILDVSDAVEHTLFLPGMTSELLNSIIEFMYTGTLNWNKKHNILQLTSTLQLQKLEKLLLSQNENICKSKVMKDVSNPEIDLEMLQCKKCSKVFKSKTAVKNHYESIHKGVRYTCNDCGSEFTLQSSLRTHTKAMHVGKLIACDQCEYETPRPDNLKTHKINVHSGEQEGPTLKEYECEKCDFSTKYCLQLRDHVILKHEREKLMICSQCNFQATSEGKIKNHVKKVHEGISFPCPDCNFVASIESFLKRHYKKKHEGFVKIE